MGTFLLLKSVHIENFRSIQDETLNCDDLTALVGENNSGKSSFLKAIELFQNKSSQIDEKDWYNRNTKKNIVIAITFCHLSNSATSLFNKYIQNDELTVKLVFKWQDDKAISSFHGETLQNKDFQTFFSKKTVQDAKPEYNKLCEIPKYKNFGDWPGHANAKKKLMDWQDEHPDQCKRSSDEGKFFGYSEVAKGYLGKFVRFLYVPAVRDAANDAEEGTDSNLTLLLDIAFRKNFIGRESTKKFQTEIKKSYDGIITASNTELKTLQGEITDIFHKFIPNTQIVLSWESFKEPNIMPKAGAEFEEDNHQYTITRMGHGLQRSFIMTMLQYLAEKQSRNADTIPQLQEVDDPTLIFLIEEPELYQHPNRQRHMAKIFFSLLDNKNSILKKTQIIYSTHSPYFIDIDIIDQIRLLRKIPSNNRKPNVTKISQTTLQEIVEELAIYVGGSSNFTPLGLKARIQTIMTPWMNEGFFSDVVVLVEGELDRAALIGCAESMKQSFERSGISVIPCFGKTNLLKPSILFKKLGIKIYVMWDNDHKNNDPHTEVNRHLLSLFHEEIEEYPSDITKDFACFEKDIEKTLEDGIGKELFEKYLDEFGESVGIFKRKEAKKRPYIISQVMKKLKEINKPCVKLEEIVQHIFNLKASTSTQFKDVK